MYVCIYIYVHICTYIYTKHTRLLQAIRYVLKSNRYWWDSRNRHDEGRNMVLPHVVKPEMDVNIVVQSQTNGKLRFPPTVFDKRCMRNWKGGVFPHITVWGSCFLLGSRRLPPRPLSQSSQQYSSHHSPHLPLTLTLITAILITPLISPPSSQHYSSPHLSPTTYHTSLIKPQLITAPLLTPPSPQHYSHNTHSTPFHTFSSQHYILIIDNSSQLAFAPLGRGWLSCGRRSTQSLLAELRRAWSPLVVWQAQRTEPSGGAAHRASSRSCGARGRRLGRGWLSSEPSGGCGARGRCLAAGFRVAGAAHRVLCRGWLSVAGAAAEPSGGAAVRVVAALSCDRRSTQILLAELRRAWAPLGPRVAFVWQAQHAEPSGGAAVRVAAAGLRLAFGAGRVAAAGLRMVFVWQEHYTEPSGGAAARVAAAGPRLAFVWQEHYTEPSGGAAARVAAADCGWLSCGRSTTQSLLAELRRAWRPLTVAGFRVAGAVHRASWRSCWARGRRWPAAACRVVGAVHRASWRSSCATTIHTTLSHTTFHTHHLWHTIFYTPSFTRNFVTHHLWHTIFHTPLCHPPSLTHHLSHHFVLTPLCHPPSLTHHLSHHFVTHHVSHTNLSHTIFHTPLSHTIFHITFSHHLSHTTLSHTIFDTPSFTHNFVTHHLSPHLFCRTPSFTTPSFTHTHLCHTQSFLHLLLCLSFLPGPRYKMWCLLLEEVDLWGYPVLLFSETQWANSMPRSASIASLSAPLSRWFAELQRNHPNFFLDPVDPVVQALRPQPQQADEVPKWVKWVSKLRNKSLAPWRRLAVQLRQCNSQEFDFILSDFIWSYIYLTLSAFLFVYLSFYLFVYLSVYLFVYPSISYLSVCMSMYLSIYRYTYLPTYQLMSLTRFPFAACQTLRFAAISEH